MMPIRDPSSMVSVLKQRLDNLITKTLMVEIVVSLEEISAVAHYFELLGLCEK
jgi:hypothetical protein